MRKEPRINLNALTDGSLLMTHSINENRCRETEVPWLAIILTHGKAE